MNILKMMMKIKTNYTSKHCVINNNLRFRLYLYYKCCLYFFRCMVITYELKTFLDKLSICLTLILWYASFMKNIDSLYLFLNLYFSNNIIYVFVCKNNYIEFELKTILDILSICFTLILGYTSFMKNNDLLYLILNLYFSHNMIDGFVYKNNYVFYTIYMIFSLVRVHCLVRIEYVSIETNLSYSVRDVLIFVKTNTCYSNILFVLSSHSDRSVCEKVVKVYIVLEYMLSLNYVINCHISEKIKCVSIHVMIYYILFTFSKQLVLNNKNVAVGMLLITFAYLKLVGIFQGIFLLSSCITSQKVKIIGLYLIKNLFCIIKQTNFERLTMKSDTLVLCFYTSRLCLKKSFFNLVVINLITFIYRSISFIEYWYMENDVIYIIIKLKNNLFVLQLYFYFKNLFLSLKDKHLYLLKLICASVVNFCKIIWFNNIRAVVNYFMLYKINFVHYNQFGYIYELYALYFNQQICLKSV